MILINMRSPACCAGARPPAALVTIKISAPSGAGCGSATRPAPGNSLRRGEISPAIPPQDATELSQDQMPGVTGHGYRREVRYISIGNHRCVTDAFSQPSQTRSQDQSYPGMG